MCRSDRPSARGGTQPTPRRASRTRKPSVTSGSGRGFCFAQARVSEVMRPPAHRFLPRAARRYHPRFITPCKVTNSTPSRSGAPAPGGVVPSERQWATQRARRDEEGAPRPLERRAGRSSSPAGTHLSAMGGAAARGTCAAWAARARPWRRASAARDGPARPPRTAPPRPADALRSPPIAGGEVELALLCAEGQGTQPALGRAYRAR